MKTLKLAGGLVVVALILGLSSGRVFARLAGTDPGTDVWCAGTSGLEVCLDASGNLIPTTTGVGSLGTSSLKFNALNMSGNASIGGTATVTGILTENSAIRLTSLNASTTGQTVVAVAAQTADLVDVSSISASAATVRVTAKGQVILKVLTKALIDAEVPDAVGAALICSNCTIPYSLCTATGTAAAQWARAGSASVGCGTNN